MDTSYNLYYVIYMFPLLLKIISHTPNVSLYTVIKNCMNLIIVIFSVLRSRWRTVPFLQGNLHFAQIFFFCLTGKFKIYKTEKNVLSKHLGIIIYKLKKICMKTKICSVNITELKIIEPIIYL